MNSNDETRIPVSRHAKVVMATVGTLTLIVALLLATLVKPPARPIVTASPQISLAASSGL